MLGEEKEKQIAAIEYQEIFRRLAKLEVGMENLTKIEESIKRLYEWASQQTVNHNTMREVIRSLAGLTEREK